MASGLMAIKQSRVSTTFLHPVIATLQRSVTRLVITPSGHCSIGRAQFLQGEVSQLSCHQGSLRLIDCSALHFACTALRYSIPLHLT